MENNRGYQKDFYKTHVRIQDVEKRKRKANKIKFLLQDFLLEEKYPLCLDIGCSSGVITSELSCFFNRIIGLEYEFSALLEFPKQSNKKNIQFVNGDAMNFPIGTSSIDCLICAQVYEHVPNSFTLFSEMTRVLRKEGLIFFSGPNKNFPIELHYNLPFLHWLPEKIANKYLEIFRNENIFYEKIRSYKELIYTFQKDYEIIDLNIKVLQNSHLFFSKWWTSVVKIIPNHFLKFLLPIMPNINWILIKK